MFTKQFILKSQSPALVSVQQNGTKLSLGHHMTPPQRLGKAVVLDSYVELYQHTIVASKAQTK